MSDRNHHNDGQKDGSNNSYTPPHEQGLWELVTPYTDKELEDRSDYDKGWDNGYKNR